MDRFYRFSREGFMRLTGPYRVDLTDYANIFYAYNQIVKKELADARKMVADLAKTIRSIAVLMYVCSFKCETILTFFCNNINWMLYIYIHVKNNEIIRNLNYSIRS